MTAEAAGAARTRGEGACGRLGREDNSQMGELGPVPEVSVPLPMETGLDPEQGWSRVGPKLHSQQRWLMQVNSYLT